MMHRDLLEDWPMNLSNTNAISFLRLAIAVYSSYRMKQLYGIEAPKYVYEYVYV